MATIANTLLTATGYRVITETTLNGTSDTFTYLPGVGQVLTFRNPTAGAISPVLDGADGTTVVVATIGVVTVSAGLTQGNSIAAGAVKAVPLDSVSAYLQGVITINSGTGLVATMTSY